MPCPKDEFKHSALQKEILEEFLLYSEIVT